MTVKKEESGRRTVQVEVEVPGTPEEVWQAIATGPGISSWFVATTLDERDGGAIALDFGPGMESKATVTSWDPPRRFTAESHDWGADAPPVATEWTVEARSGDTCVVRVVHSLFASTDDWDGQLEGTESGWPRFFSILRLYLTHFRGQPCSLMSAHGSSAGSASSAWEAVTGALGLAGASGGQGWSTPEGVPPMSGTIERLDDDGEQPSGLLRLTEPVPGIASATAFAMGEQAHVAISFYLYGDGAGAVAERDAPRWETWMKEVGELDRTAPPTV